VVSTKSYVQHNIHKETTNQDTANDTIGNIQSNNPPPEKADLFSIGDSNIAAGKCKWREADSGRIRANEARFRRKHTYTTAARNHVMIQFVNITPLGLANK